MQVDDGHDRTSLFSQALAGFPKRLEPETTSLVLFSNDLLWHELATRTHLRTLDAGLSLEEFETRLYDVESLLRELVQVFRAWKAKDKEGLQSFWFHRHIQQLLAPPAPRQRFELPSERETVDRSGLLQCSAFYLARPWLQHDGLDWCFLDAVIFSESEAFVKDLYKVGALKNPSLWSFVKGAATAWLPHWLLPYTSSQHDDETKKLRQMLGEALDVYTYCAPPVINPLRLGQQLDRAREQAVHFPGVVYSLFDRIAARDNSTFIPFQNE